MHEQKLAKDRKPSNRRTQRRRHRSRLKILLMFMVAGLILVVSWAAWLGFTALGVRDDLTAANALLPAIKKDIAEENPENANESMGELQRRMASATTATSQPLWTVASALPILGPNFAALSEISRTGEDVTNLGLVPLLQEFENLDWNELLPSHEGANLEPLRAAAPSVKSAAQAVELSAERLDQVNTEDLLPEIAEPLVKARTELRAASGTLSGAASAAELIPGMLGAESPRQYLLMIQNNAEVRASGGIPGALAVLTFDNGKLSLDRQTSAGNFGAIQPAVPVDQEQQQIYTSRLGKYMQDVNLTPDFPTAASTAQAIWEKKTGQHLDGVVSIDPVVLGYVLQSTGPVAVNGPELTAVRASGLPTELTGDNVVSTLLSDVYAKIKQPELQDAYFAGVAKEVFSALSTGKGEAQGLVSGITRGTEEGRVLVWSANGSEQSVISKYPLSGSISGPSVSPAQFGIYFNDGTGAKMDYYVKRTVKLVKECPADGYEQTTVRVTSTNTAPSDAATSLPAYVTGAGAFGVAPGTVQTNIVAYGPAQANVESATVDGQKTPFAPYIHANRPVGVVAQQLAPGESKTVDFTFGKIVQHAEPNVVVTPTVQPVKDVILPTENAPCGQGQ